MALLLLTFFIVYILRIGHGAYVPCNRCVVAMNRDAMSELNMVRVAQGKTEIDMGTADMLWKAKLRAKMMCGGKLVGSPKKLACGAKMTRVEMSSVRYKNGNPALQCVKELMEPMRDIELGVVGVHYSRRKNLVCCYWIFARDAQFQDNEKCSDV